jgi:hypothetical protein
MPSTSFREIIEWWPTTRALAEQLDVRDETVRQWKTNGIPAPYWQALLETEIARRHRLTPAVLVRLVDRRLTT